MIMKINNVKDFNNKAISYLKSNESTKFNILFALFTGEGNKKVIDQSKFILTSFIFYRFN